MGVDLLRGGLVVFEGDYYLLAHLPKHDASDRCPGRTTTSSEKTLLTAKSDIIPAQTALRITSSQEIIVVFCRRFLPDHGGEARCADAGAVTGQEATLAKAAEGELVPRRS
jgi:hypothetical protein